MVEKFWTNGDSKHQEIAKKFYEGIEITHPDYVTSNRLCPYFTWSEYERTSVTYLKYRGENI